MPRSGQAMLATAAAVFNGRGLASAGSDLGVVFAGLNSYVGAHAGTVFGVALLVSYIACSCLGTMSGQIVTGFYRRHNRGLRRVLLSRARRRQVYWKSWSQGGRDGVVDG